MTDHLCSALQILIPNACKYCAVLRPPESDVRSYIFMPDRLLKKDIELALQLQSTRFVGVAFQVLSLCALRCPMPYDSRFSSQGLSFEAAPTYLR